MSQQYYFNNPQYTAPTSYPAQTTIPCYTANSALPPPTTYSAATTVRTTIAGSYVAGTSNSSAHRSQAPVTYTYPTNPTVIAQPLVVLPGQQATVAKVVQSGSSFVLANGLPSQPNMTNSGPYTVTTSYFQQIPGQTQAQHQSMAHAAAAAVAQQANYHAAMLAANNSSNRRNVFDPRFQNFRKNSKTTVRSSIDSQIFYCDVCKISCAGPQTYKEHLDGQKHKKKASGNIIITNTSSKSTQRQLRCELCDVTCTGVDAYQAHIRGTKHQKTFKLHQRLGKPIPCSDPLIVKEPQAITSDAKVDVQNVVGPKIPVNEQLEADGKATTVEEHVDIESIQERSVPPVGGEYIETTTNESGKVVQFSCKLCSCKFNDPHAKDMHLKGRRHRLQYKKKVDPNLIVDLKNSNNRTWKVQEERMRLKQQHEEMWRRRDSHSRMQDMHRLEWSNHVYNGSNETVDDRQVVAKHSEVIPLEQEVREVQMMVAACERALKRVSEAMNEGDEEDESKTVISCAMRVGPLAKGVLLRGELTVSLVLMCSHWPTSALLDDIRSRMQEFLQKELPNDKNISVSLNTEYGCLLVSRKVESLPDMYCYVHLTSAVVREDSADGASPVQPEDGLDKKRCLDALASLRHTKWFQAKLGHQPPCVMLTRILRDLCERVPTWTPLSSWAVELLVDRVMSSWSSSPSSSSMSSCADSMGGYRPRMTPGAALRRFFECVASGVLLPGGPGLRDPCEKAVVDASAVLAVQEREDITESAQHALRLIAFRQSHKVLDMEMVSVGWVRKRPHSGGEATGDGKKERSEPEEPVPKVETETEVKAEADTVPETN